MADLTRREREKQVRKSEIIAAAGKVFSRRGYLDATMDEIARSAQFTKRTVYQYFSSKDDLYFAVARQAMEKLVAGFRAAGRPGQTGLQTIRSIGEAYYHFMVEEPDLFQLLNLSQAMQMNYAESENYRLLAGQRDELFRQFAEVIRRGQADGSIRPELEPGRGALAIFLLITGFFYRLSLVGGLYGLDRNSFVGYTLDLVDEAIRARPEDRR